MKQALLGLVTLTVLGAGGCGGGSDSGDAGEPAGGDVPTCADVWKVGETLDLNTYEGCQDGDTVIAAVTRGCYDANSKYVGQVATFEDRLWVVQKGTDQKTGEGGTPGKVTDVDPKC